MVTTRMVTTLIAALAAALVLPPAASAQRPADPIPLRPGTIGVGFPFHYPGSPFRVEVQPRSPAAAAGVESGMELKEVDGRAVAGRTVAGVETALVGPIGSTVELTVCRMVERRGRSVCRGEPIGVRVRRADHAAPAPGYSEVVETARFVVHHRPGEEQRRQARALAREAERRYAAAGLPRDTEGRRAHVWLQPTLTAGPILRLEPWATYAPPERTAYGFVERVFGYLAYGYPGSLADRLGTGMDNVGMRGWVRSSHRAVFAELLAARDTIRPEPKRIPGQGSSASWGSDEAISLRYYVLERYGAQGFRRLWQSDLRFDDAVPRALGIPADTLMHGWRSYILDLGPNPDAPLDPRAVAVTLGWGAVALLYGAWTARRKEAG